MEATHDPSIHWPRLRGRASTVRGVLAILAGSALALSAPATISADELYGPSGPDADVCVGDDVTATERLWLVRSDEGPRFAGGTELVLSASAASSDIATVDASFEDDTLVLPEGWSQIPPEPVPWPSQYPIPSLGPGATLPVNAAGPVTLGVRVHGDAVGSEWIEIRVAALPEGEWTTGVFVTVRDCASPSPTAATEAPAPTDEGDPGDIPPPATATTGGVGEGGASIVPVLATLSAVAATAFILAGRLRWHAKG